MQNIFLQLIKSAKVQWVREKLNGYCEKVVCNQRGFGRWGSVDQENSSPQAEYHTFREAQEKPAWCQTSSAQLIWDLEDVEITYLFQTMFLYFKYFYHLFISPHRECKSWVDLIIVNKIYTDKQQSIKENTSIYLVYFNGSVPGSFWTDCLLDHSDHMKNVDYTVR